MRGKIILPNFIAILVLGVGSFLFLKADLSSKAKSGLREKMKMVSTLFVRSETLHGFELLNVVRKEALSKSMVQAFSPVQVQPNSEEDGAVVDATNKQVKRELFAKCSSAIKSFLKEWQKVHKERPDLILLTDRSGEVISRNVTPNACPSGFKVTGSMSMVERALDGEASYGVWSVDDSPFSSKRQDSSYCQLMNTGLLELAAAPVWFGDDIAGALVIGFEISNGTAQNHAKQLGLDVAVLNSGQVYSSSFKTETARQSLEKALKSSDVTQTVSESLEKGTPSPIFDISVEGESYYAISLPNINADKKDGIVTLIMGAEEAATSGLGALSGIWGFMGIGILIVLIGGVLLSNHFMKPIMAIEEGVLKVINGEYNYRFDVKSSEVGGLSYRINQMIGVLLGEEEESDDD